MRKYYFLDTNHLSHALGKVSTLRDRIRQGRRQGFRFGTCWPALFELEVGMSQTREPEVCRRNLKVLLKEVSIWAPDWKLMRGFGEVHHLLKQRGRILSHTDKVLAAMARIEKATLLTTDRDFEAIPEIKTENWIANS